MKTENNKMGSNIRFNNNSVPKQPAEKISIHHTNTSSSGQINKTQHKPGMSNRTTSINSSQVHSSRASQMSSKNKELYEIERKLTTLLSIEAKKTSSVKKDLHQKSLRNFKDNLVVFSKCLLVGIFVFCIIASFITLSYYRSMTQYDSEYYEFEIFGYDYIDLSDESEKNNKKLEERKTGVEKPAFSLKEKIIVRDSVAYVPYSAIDDFFGFSIAGDKESRTISVGSSDSYFEGDNSADFRFDTNEIRVNGANQIVNGTPIIENGEFYLPYEFIESYIHGISIDKNVDNRLTTISITKISPNIYFGGSSNKTLLTPEYSAFLGESQTEHRYTVDMSAFEKYISPADKDKYLILVNINNILGSDYAPNDLKNIKTSESRPTQQICFDAAMSLTAMLQAADAAGFNDLAVTTGYRSYSHQSSLFNQKLKVNQQKYDNETAERITSESVIYPGASEHQTGLAVDLHNLSTPMQSFSNTNEYKWLIEHCADFGFILRYPQTKEDITGVKYEPWHFRFVGRDHAQKIMSEGICLEEYLQIYSKSTADTQ